MSKLLEKAIAKVRELPEEEQEQAAKMMLSWAELAKQGIYHLSDEERAAVRIGLEQARKGEFVSDEEMERFWNRDRP